MTVAAEELKCSTISATADTFSVLGMSLLSYIWVVLVCTGDLYPARQRRNAPAQGARGVVN
jgi:hypothetical protein